MCAVNEVQREAQCLTHAHTFSPEPAMPSGTGNTLLFGGGVALRQVNTRMFSLSDRTFTTIQSHSGLFPESPLKWSESELAPSSCSVALGRREARRRGNTAAPAKLVGSRGSGTFRRCVIDSLSLGHIQQYQGLVCISYSNL